MRLIFPVLAVILSSITNAQLPLQLVVPTGHQEPIAQVTITPDSRRVITSGTDKKVILWDMNSGLQLRELHTSGHLIENILIDPTGKRILGGNRYEKYDSLPLWDQNGNLISWLKHARDVKSAEFFDNGKQIMTAGYDGMIRFWNAATGSLISEINTGQTLLWFAKISDDGSRVMAALKYNIVMYEVATGNKLLTLEGHSGIISDAAVSPNGKFIATTSLDKTAIIWDASGQKLRALDLGEEGDELFFNSTSETLVVRTDAIGSGGAELFEVSTGKKIQTLVPKKNEVRVVSMSPDKNLIVTAFDYDTTAVIWDARTGKKLHQLNAQYGTLDEVIFTADGQKILTKANIAHVWDLQTAKLLTSYRSSQGGFTDMALSPDGSTMVLSDGVFSEVWNLNRNELEAKLQTLTAPIHSISYTKDGKYLITDNSTKTFRRLWQISTGEMNFVNIYQQNDLERMLFSRSDSFVMADYKYPRSPEVIHTYTGVRVPIHDGGTPTTRWAFSPDEKYLITSDIDRIIKVFDPSTGRLLRVIDGKFKETISGLLVSPDSKTLVIYTFDEILVFFDLETGKELSRIPNFHKKVGDVAFLDNSHWILSENYDGLNKIWNGKTGELQMTLTGHKASVHLYYLSPDHSRLITAAHDEENLKLWDLNKKKLITELKGHGNTVNKLKVSPDGKYLVTAASFESAIKVWNTYSGELLYTFPGHDRHITDMIISTDNRLFTIGGDHLPISWDLNTGKRLKVFLGHADNLRSMAFNESTNELLTASTHIMLWDATTGVPKSILQYNTTPITAVAFGPRPGNILSASSDHSVRLWSVADHKILQTFLPIAGGEYFSSVDGGYYKTSPGAAKKIHYVTNDLQPVSFEQLDVIYNRPDMVLAKTGSPDTALISSFRKAYEKRVRKLGIDTSALLSGLNIPNLEVVDRDKIQYDQSSDQLKLHIRAKDDRSTLTSLNVWINEVPVFGNKGLKVFSNSVDTTITITLSSGLNVIEAGVKSKTGMESFRSPIRVAYRPQVEPEEKIYFIGIGIDKYRDSTKNLRYSVKDIRDLAAALRRKYGEKLVVDTLLDADVSAKSIRGLKAKLLQTGINDKVIVSYSGHGLLSDNYDYYLSTSEVNFNKPEIGGLLYEDLENLLDSIPSRKKLLMIDACHSGEVDKEEMARYTFVEKTEKDTSTRSGRKPSLEDAKLGMKSSFQLMQELFVNVSRSTGATVISAAAGTQFALERDNLENGVFTFAVIEYIRSRYQETTISDLKNYVNRRVPELTNGLQVPTTRSEVKAVDWKLW